MRSNEQFLSFINERIVMASSKETETAYRIVRDQFNKIFDKNPYYIALKTLVNSLNQVVDGTRQFTMNDVEYDKRGLFCCELINDSEYDTIVLISFKYANGERKDHVIYKKSVYSSDLSLEYRTIYVEFMINMLFGLRIDDTNAKIGNKIRFIPITDLMNGNYLLDNYKKKNKDK